MSGGIVLATSNGTGMGHLARQSSVALALGVEVGPVVFSLSTAVHVLQDHDLAAEYCPSHHRGWMPHARWHRYLRDRVSALLDETGAKVLAFDGVAPYLGLLRARAAHPDVAFVWVRRGMWRPDANRRLLSGADFFDLVVEPGEFARAADRGPTASAPAVRLSPISLTSQVERLSRTQAARALGLDPSRPTALVTLGAGTINDVTTPAAAAIGAFLEAGDWQVAVTRAPIATSGPHAADPRLRLLAGVYPLARYLAAFDATVSAAGYNAVHELLSAGVPTLLVPNRATATDDQVARAWWARWAGVALYAEEAPEAVRAGVGMLLDPSVRADLAAACVTLPAADGAVELAERLRGLAATFPEHRRGPRELVRSGGLTLKLAGMQALGSTGVRLFRQAMG
ncbi:MAG TPA: glycosyltransferase, partial [Actinopolymorphaceae bacterium]